MIERPPVAPATAVRRLARCVLTTFGLLGQRRIRLPKGRVGLQLHFADGTASKVYRETVVDRSATIDPAVLVVGFRLRVVRSQLAHALFRFESVFSTPLFVGFQDSSPSCGWRTIPVTPTEGSMNGTARRSPRTTCGPCGACWRWCACLGQSTMRLCSASPGRNW